MWKELDYMGELLASLGKTAGVSVTSIFWIAEEPECPKSLIK